MAEHQKEIQKRDTFVKLATEYSITLTNYDADAMVTEYAEVILLMFICVLKHFSKMYASR